MTLIVGIDLGGTKIAAVLLDMETEQIRARLTIPTDGQAGPTVVMQRMGQLVRDVSADAGLSLDDIAAVGVGAPAIVDYEQGRTLLVPNIPGDWHGQPVEERMQSDLGRPVALVNDARAFTLAEANLGAGRGSPTVVGITLGTGIGGGITINGELHLGVGGNAGEVGHHTVDINGPPDGSGTPGAIEALASGPAIAAAGIKAVMQGLDTQIGALVDYDLNRITPQVIGEAALAGDTVAQDIFNHAGRTIGAGIANVVTILSPHCIVIGGGVAQLGDLIFEPLRTGLQRYNNTVDLQQVKIVPAQLGEDAGAIGAALWAYQRNRK